MYLEDSGVECELYAKIADRANLVARIPGAGGPRLALLSHTDTVLADAAEWELDPWSGEAYWELFSTSYGPTKTLAESLGERREEFHQTWVEFFETNYRRDGEIDHDREYLLVLGTRR